MHRSTLVESRAAPRAGATATVRRPNGSLRSAWNAQASARLRPATARLPPCPEFHLCSQRSNKQGQRRSDCDDSRLSQGCEGRPNVPFCSLTYRFHRRRCRFAQNTFQGFKGFRRFRGFAFHGFAASLCEPSNPRRKWEPIEQQPSELPESSEPLEPTSSVARRYPRHG
jgi:hypothetical protein